jgi:NADH-quinone oxidoreductase subunit N
MTENLPFFLPEIYLAISAFCLLLFGAFRGDKGTIYSIYLAEGSLVVAGLLVLLMPNDGTLLAGMAVVDGFGRFVKIVLLAAAFFSLLLAPDYLERLKLARPEYPVLVLFATLGMMTMVSAHDFMALYVGLEMQSLALYVLAAYRRDFTASTEAGLKYFILGAFSSALMLYGISMLYGFAGATGFREVAAALSGHAAPLGVTLGFVFVIAGIAFKLSAVPFHMWTPDVYEGAPTPVTAFFAAAPKIAALALFIRVLAGPLAAFGAACQPILIFLAVASMIWGAFAGLRQKNIKRLMAYSAIVNIGFMLIGAVVGGDEGLSTLLNYLAIYVVNTLGAFGVILCLRRNGKGALRLSDMAGMSKSHPYLAAAMAVFMFSLAGVPPMAGFFAKYFVLFAAVHAGFVYLAVLGLLTSVAAAFYYLRIVKIIYFDAEDEALDPVPELTLRAVTGLAAVGILFFVVDPSLLLDRAVVAAKSLLIL